MFTTIRRAFRPRARTDYAAGALAKTEPTPSYPTPPVRTAPNTGSSKTAPVDDAQKKAEAKDESTEQEEGRDESDTRQPVTKTETTKTKVIKNENQKEQTAASSSTYNSAYTGFWNLEVDYHLEEEFHGIAAEFTPNAQALFFIIDICDQFVSGNSHLQRYHPEYLHFGTVCYYAFLFYYQILRARRAAGKLTTPELKFIRRLEKRHAPQNLVVAGPIFPFLASIISHEFADGKYDWIVPRIATENFFATMADFAPGQGSVYLQPMLPYMLGNLRLFITNHLKTEINAHADQYFDDSDELVPHTFSNTAAQTIFGMPMHRGTATNADHLLLLSSSGYSSRSRIDVDQIRNAQRNWSRSVFTKVHISPTGIGAAPRGTDALITNTDGTAPINTLARFMLMDENSDMEYFDKLKQNAEIHAKMFKNSTTLSNVPTVGGNEATILATFKRSTATHAASNDYGDVRLGVNQNNFDWYPAHFNDMTATFATDRADVQREEEFQAFAFGINAELPITQAANVRVGNTNVQRTGAYFRNREQLTFDYRNGDNIGKPMFAGWSSMIQSTFALEKPSDA